MTIQNPPVLEHGFVVGRYVTAVADTLQDDDRYPDLRPITGRVRFTPLQSVHLKGGEYPATVVKQPITVDLNEQGYVEDVESRNDPNRDPGVYLAVGHYRVEPIFEQAARVDRFTIQVTAGHTKEAPLDLTLAAPIETPPGFTEVVRIIDRVRAEDAADAAEGHAATALVYRDEAASSATTAQTHSTTAGESAEAAEGHADRAEQARDETVSNAIEVDTSAGTKVTVGGHVVHYDSGWRDVSNLALPEWTPPTGSRRIRLWRVGDQVFLEGRFDRAEGGESRGGSADILSIPAGFRPPDTYSLLGQAGVFSDIGAVYTNASRGDVRIRGLTGTWSAGDTVSISANWRTRDDYPTSLPGTPA